MQPFPKPNAPLRVLLHPLTVHAGGIYRIGQPAEALREAGRMLTNVSMRFVDEANAELIAPDVIVVQNPYHDLGQQYLRQYSKLQPKPFLIYELDDLLWDIPDTNPHKPQFPADIKPRIVKALKHCNRIIVSTEGLAKAVIRDLGYDKTKVVVVHNRLSKSFLTAAREARGIVLAQPQRKLRVGWAGGISHAADLNVIRSVVERTKDLVQWVFMGMTLSGVDGLESHPGVPFGEYATAIGKLDLDIGIAPLVINQFNECKSNLRLLELGSAGIPVIATDVGAYKDSPAVLLPNDPDRWIAEIDRMVADSDYRIAQGNKLFSWIKTSYLQENESSLDDWQAALSPKGPLFRLAEPVTPSDEVEVVSTGAALWTAIQEKPGTNILYVRPGTKVLQEHKAMLLKGLEDGEASVSAITNDGIYPAQGSFVPMTPDEAARTTHAAAMASAGEVLRPAFILGPLTLLSGAALVKYGSPNLDRYDDVESAICDWTTRVTGAGGFHRLAVNVFAAVEASKSQEEAMTARREIAFWHPHISNAASAFSLRAAEHPFRRDIDLKRYFLAQAALATERGEDDTTQHLLVINATPEALEWAKESGHTVLAASLLGHLLCLDTKVLPNVPTLDIRRDLPDLVEILRDTCTSRVILNGVREGSLEILGLLVALQQHGVQVDYAPMKMEYVCPRVDTIRDGSPCGDLWQEETSGSCQACVDRCGSQFGFVDVPAYRSTWARFLRSLPQVSA